MINGTNDDDKGGPYNADHPLGTLIGSLEVVIEPRGSEGPHRHERRKQGANKRDQRSEVRDSQADNIGRNCDAKGAGQPNDPVGLRVRDQVLRTLERAQKDVLGRIVGHKAG